MTGGYNMWPKRKSKSEPDAFDLMASTDAVVALMDHTDLNECWRLDQRCFSDGEAYDRETIRYLLSHHQAVCYKTVTAGGEMIAFVVGMIEPDCTGHVVALGVDPEYRRLGIGRDLMHA